MLRDQNQMETPDRSSSKTWRGLTSLALLGLTLGVATLRGPASVADEPTAAPAVAKSSGSAMNEPITPLYVPDDVAGLVAFRPASIYRRMGRGEAFSYLLSDSAGVELPGLAQQLKVDTSRPGFLKLAFEDIEWATCGLRFGRVKNKQSHDGGELHTFAFVGLTVRTLKPVDWLTFLRQWGVELAEAQEGGRAYYQIKGLLRPILGPSPCVCVLDDRTIVLDEEAGIRSMLAGTTPVRRAFLNSPDWNRASRGLFALALDGEGETFARQYDLGRPDDAVVLSLMKGVSHWTLGVEDADSLAIRLSGTCRDGQASEAIVSTIIPYLKQGHDALKEEPPSTASASDKMTYFMIKRLMANLQLQNSDHSVDLRTQGFGTMADVGSILDAEIQEAKAHRQARADKAGTTKK
jgi:hypothetical protein